MNEKPRTWTVCNAFGTGLTVNPDDTSAVSLSEEVSVIELEPVLDLLEAASRAGIGDLKVHVRIKDLLREHGRLK